MATVQWRPEVNPLTTPQSYRPRHLPNATQSGDELAAEIALENPIYNEALGKGFIGILTEKIKQSLIKGNQVALEQAFTFRLSLNGRLDAPDDPLPPIDEVLNVRVSVSRSFLEDVRQDVQLERLPMSEKLPLITSAEDTVFRLNDVLNATGALRLTGSDLLLDQNAAGSECVLEGTRSGKTVQSRFVLISNSEITFLPDIPAQDAPHNNEYTLSVSTHYTEHGTLRTGIYRRRLRTPLILTNFSHPNPPEVGILTDKSSTPYVTVTGGTLTANETVRIQVILDLHEGHLLFNLLAMEDGGGVGDAVTVTADGAQTLPGFADSALSSLDLTVNSYSALTEMVRSHYSGRLVDVLDIRTN